MESSANHLQFMTASCLACCSAEICTLPFDTLKVRRQLIASNNKLSTINTLSKLLKDEGVATLWNGLPAGLQRQLIFGTLRFSLYTPIRDILSNWTGYNESASPFLIKVASGMLSGAIAMLIANPTDVVKVRLQGDMSKKISSDGSRHAARYNGVTHAYRMIWRTEGLKGLYSGLGANVTRNCITNAAEVATYDQIKQFLLFSGLVNDGFSVHLAAGFLAGGTAAVVASPVDVIKTNLMHSQSSKYEGALNKTRRIVKSLGFRGLYRGFIPNCLRIGTFNMCCFAAMEYFRKVLS